MMTLLAGLAIGIGAVVIGSIVKINNPALPLLSASVSFYEKTIQFMISDFVLIDFDNGVLETIWRVISATKPIIIGVASSLAVIFFMLNLFSEVQDLHRDITPKTLFKVLISIGVTEILIISAYDIVSSISKILITLATMLDNGIRKALAIQNIQSGTLNEQTLEFLNKKGSALEMGFLAVVTLIIVVVIVISAISVIRYFIERAIHLVILSLLAPIFIAFFINKHTISMAVNYLKEIAFKYAEGVATVLAIILVGLLVRLIGMQIFDFTEQYQVIFSVMFTVSATTTVVMNVHRIFDRIR